VRDATFTEDASQVRDRHRPTHHGVPAQPGDRRAQPRRAVNLGAALRHHARDPARPLTTLVSP